MDPQRPRARRLGILHGRIVGLDDQLDGWDAAERLDLDGRLRRARVRRRAHPPRADRPDPGVGRHQRLLAPRPAALDVIAAAAPAHAADDDWVEVGGYDHRVLGRHLTAGELDAGGPGAQGVGAPDLRSRVGRVDGRPRTRCRRSTAAGRTQPPACSRSADQAGGPRASDCRTRSTRSRRSSSRAAEQARTRGHHHLRRRRQRRRDRRPQPGRRGGVPGRCWRRAGCRYACS